MLRGDDKKLHDRIRNRYEDLKKIRITHESKWREISDFVNPTLGEFPNLTRNDGGKNRGKIINSTAGNSLNIAVAGMLAGTMSPSRPWFELESELPGMDKDITVRAWMQDTRDLLLDIFNDSTFYQAVPSTLAHALAFGNGALYHTDDFDSVAFFRDVPTGSFVWGQNHKSEIDTLGYKCDKSAHQIRAMFPDAELPQNVLSALRDDNMQQDFEVLHWIEPNTEYNPTKAAAKYKKFASIYLLLDSEESNKAFLDRSGFDEFPFHPLRWDVKGSDVYASGSPGIDSLGDVMQLQATEKMKTRAQQKMVDPPLQGPATLRGKPVSSMAGGLTLFQSAAQDGQGLRTLYQVNLPIQEIRGEIDAIQRRIEQAWFTDLFFAISRMEGVQPKNMMELAQRNQERLLQLGPVLLRLHREFLGGIIARTFNQCVRADILPPAPEQLQNAGLKIRYVSTMALAQQSSEVESIERMFDFVGRAAQSGFESALDGVNADKAIEKYAQIIGYPADALKTPDDVEAERQARAQQEQAQQTAALADQGASAVQKLAGSGMSDGSNVLENIMNQANGDAAA